MTAVPAVPPRVITAAMIVAVIARFAALIVSDTFDFTPPDSVASGVPLSRGSTGTRLPASGGAGITLAAARASLTAVGVGVGFTLAGGGLPRLMWLAHSVPTVAVRRWRGSIEA